MDAKLNCGCKVPSFVSTKFICACGNTHQPNERSSESESCVVTPKRWPTWAVLVKCCRSSNDAGVGDTVKQMADSIGGERFKRWAEQCGIPCGCVERQERWNKLYPYEA
jgi:hypothetical protein